MSTLTLIEEYVRVVNNVVSEMQSYFREANLLEARRCDRIPPMGVFSRENWKFSFHGVGCTVDTPRGSIDFEFGPNGTAGGFDAYRLSLFAASQCQSDGHIPTQDELQGGLTKLLEQGELIAPQLMPTPNLFYLRTGYIGRATRSGK